MFGANQGQFRGQFLPAKSNINASKNRLRRSIPCEVRQIVVIG
jgi:hypothetical protein